MGERLVVIGGDAAGMSAASQARRRRADLEIVALEKGPWTSYSACGIPYLIGGEVDRLETLVARTPQEHRDRFRIDVRLRQEAMGIDLDARELEVRDHEHERTYRLGFDLLHIATGARPFRPPLPGIDGEQVKGVQTLDDGRAMLEYAAANDLRRVVVIGGGYIGLEMAEAFLHRGAAVTVVDRRAEIMSTLDTDMGALVSAAMRKEGVDVRCGTAVEGFSPGVVHTDGGDIETDLVVLGIGVYPNATLAAEAGLTTGVVGAIRTDRQQRTSADGVWAAGDCCDAYHLVSERHAYVALGTVANKQGRVAGINLGGGYATFPGVVGTAVSKLCATEVARTGLTEVEADEAGFDYEVVKVESTTRAGYYPGAKKLLVKLLAERRSGRLLGAQIVGEEGAAKRIDVFAACLTARMTVEEMLNLDLSYAPPFSPVWDPVLIAARIAAERMGRTD